MPRLFARVFLLLAIAFATGAVATCAAGAEAQSSTPPTPPTRIVSHTVLTDEILLAVAAPEQIAALSHLSQNPRFCAVAKQAQAFPALHRDTSVEAILRFRPDLVLFTDFSRPELVTQLRRCGVEVAFFGSYNTLDETYANMRRLAKKLGGGAEARAEVLIADCRQREVRLSERLRGVKPVRVLAPSTYDFIPGDKTNFQDFCDHAGAENVAKTVGKITGHAPAPSERIPSWPVEKVVLIGDTAETEKTLPTAGDIERALRPFRRMPAYRSLDAIRKGDAALLAEWQLSCVSHHRVACYENLARQLHPEVFAEKAPENQCANIQSDKMRMP